MRPRSGGVPIDAGLPPFVVTGSARSGTSFMAKLLDTLGHPCGHERLFRPRTKEVPEFGRAQGDSSWLAAPFIEHLPPGTVVLHQVRHPVQVLRSLVGTGFLSKRPGPLRWARFHLQCRGLQVGPRVMNPAWGQYALRHCPDLEEMTDHLSRCTTYWVHWNEMVERAAGLEHLTYLRYRLEDVDVTLVRRLVGVLGGDAATSQIEAALRHLGTGTNARARDDTVDVDAVSRSAHGRSVADLAVRYGYDMEPDRKPASSEG